MPQRRKSARRSLELHSLMIRRNYSGISFGWEGDTQAFSSFYRLIRRTVLSVCLRICHDHAAAEDACAEVYLLVWRNADKFDRDRGTAMGWVSAIARNQAITCVRGNQSRDQLGATVARDADLPTIDGNLVVLANDRAKYIERRRKSLTAARRKAIRSAFFGGMTYPEIAARNNVPLSTVKS